MLEEKDVNRALVAVNREIFGVKSIDDYDLATLKICCQKQISQRPDYEGDGYADGNMVYDTWICPDCGERYEVDYDHYNYCPKCGKKLDMTLDEVEDDR